MSWDFLTKFRMLYVSQMHETGASGPILESAVKISRPSGPRPTTAQITGDFGGVTGPAGFGADLAPCAAVVISSTIRPLTVSVPAVSPRRKSLRLIATIALIDGHLRPVVYSRGH